MVERYEQQDLEKKFSDKEKKLILSKSVFISPDGLVVLVKMFFPRAILEKIYVKS